MRSVFVIGRSNDGRHEHREQLRDKDLTFTGCGTGHNLPAIFVVGSGDIALSVSDT